MNVLNTRPTEQAEALTKAIEARGGKVVSCPALEIKTCPIQWHNPPADKAIFISQNAVHYFFKQVSPKNWNTPTFAIGQATAKALAHYNITCATPLLQAGSEHLLALPAFQTIKQQHILLIKGQAGYPLLADTLIQRGAIVTPLAVYERVLPAQPKAFYEKIWREEAIDIILFTSQQAMTQLFSLFGKKATHWLRHRPCLVISERLADAAKTLGIKTIFVTSPNHIIEGLDDAYESLTKAGHMKEKTFSHKTLFFILFLLTGIACLTAFYTLSVTYHSNQTLAQEKQRGTTLAATLATLNEAHASLQTELSQLNHQLSTTQGFTTQNKLWLAEQVRYYLELAHLEAISGNNDVLPCQVLIKQAQKLLIAMNESSLQPVQAASTQALETLAALPQPNTVEVLTRIHHLEDLIHQTVTPAPTTPTEVLPPLSSTWQTHIKKSIDTLQHLVTIKHRDIGTLPASTIQQTIFINRIDLNLQEASLSLPSRNSILYHMAIDRAKTNVAQAFKDQPEEENTLMADLNQLAAVVFTPPLPPLNEPLDAINAWIQINDTAFPSTPTQ